MTGNFIAQLGAWIDAYSPSDFVVCGLSVLWIVFVWHVTNRIAHTVTLAKRRRAVARMLKEPYDYAPTRVGVVETPPGTPADTLSGVAPGAATTGASCGVSRRELELALSDRSNEHEAVSHSEVVADEYGGTVRLRLVRKR